MCGIAGFLTRDEPAEQAALRRMCDRLTHRGPDGEGYYCHGRVGFGHRRLSVIDVDGGAQPLGNEDGGVQVVFNGEIYNYLDLRKELIETGHRFQTNSDTEVLVHLYEECGAGLVNHLNGMFAFAIWDEQRQALLLARDRLGKKPLYYSTDVSGLEICFASELKALLSLDGFSREANPRAVADFLCLDYVPDPETIYRAARKLPPGSTLWLENGIVSLYRYWRATPEPADGSTEDQVAAEVEDLAKDCVRRRLVSDVPLGAFLSGGVDSSAVVALMSTEGRGAVKTFSIGFRERAFDELEYTRLVAGRYATDHRERVVTPSVQEMLGTIAHHYDEPFGDASAIPMLYLCRMTRQFVTVALSGDGADEVFGGYRRYFHGVLEARLRRLFPKWFRRSAIGLAGRCYPKFDFLPQIFRAKTLLTNIANELGDGYFTSMSAFRDSDLMEALSPEMREGLGGYSPRMAFRDRFQAVKDLPPLTQMQMVDMDTYLPGDILVKADRATMAYSLEGRSPWLDYRMVELAFRIPDGMKLQGRKGKHVFKRAMRRYLPEEIVQRPKMGFATPLAHWFRTSLRETFEELVFRRESAEFLNVGRIRHLWGQHQRGLRNHEERLWNVLMLCLWNLTHNRGMSKEELEESVCAGTAGHRQLETL